MLKMIIGAVLISAGIILTFVPPFIFGPILLIAGFGTGILGIGKTAVKGARVASVAVRQPTVSPVSQDLNQAATARQQIDQSVTPLYDLKRWEALIQYDPDIAGAANDLRRFGEKYVDLLAEHFLSLNDKNYLPVIVEKLTEQAERDAVEQEDYLRSPAAWTDFSRRVRGIYSTPRGTVVLRSDFSVLSDVDGAVQQFASAEDFRSAVKDRDSVWEPVDSSADYRAELIQKFSPYL